MKIIPKQESPTLPPPLAQRARVLTPCSTQAADLNCHTAVPTVPRVPTHDGDGQAARGEAEGVLEQPAANGQHGGQSDAAAQQLLEVVQPGAARVVHLVVQIVLPEGEDRHERRAGSKAVRRAKVPRVRVGMGLFGCPLHTPPHLFLSLLRQE